MGTSCLRANFIVYDLKIGTLEIDRMASLEPAWFCGVTPLVFLVKVTFLTAVAGGISLVHRDTHF